MAIYPLVSIDSGMRRSRVVKRSPRSRAISFAGDEVTGAGRHPNTPLSRAISFAGEGSGVRVTALANPAIRES
jgi:hypothetical protein